MSAKAKARTIMADEARAGARAYHHIKQAILSGELRLRQRLDIEELARRFKVSATPVRQALAILSAERLVGGGGARGYQVAFWSEAELKELYSWRADLARLAAESIKHEKGCALALAGLPHDEAFFALMRALEADAHGEIKRAAAAADERLAAAVRAEPAVLSHSDADLAGLAQPLALGNRRLFMSRLKSYFAKRLEHCAQIRAAAHARATPMNGD